MDFESSLQREIQQHHNIPTLSDKTKKLITELCFQPYDDRLTDVLFVFGTWTAKETLAKHVLNCIRNTNPSVVILNGGPPDYEKKGMDDVSAAERVYEYIDPMLYPNTKFILETTSKNTLEEAQNAIKVYDFRTTRSLTFVAKSHAATRQMLTLKRFVPHPEYRALPYDVSYDDGSIITREKWHENADHIQRVWGQFIRIKVYGERGDIRYPDDIRDKVDHIIKKTDYRIE